MGDGGGGHWLVQMEWSLAGWSVCLPPLIFPCAIKSRSSVVALAHPGGPGKRAIKRLCVCVCTQWVCVSLGRFISVPASHGVYVCIFMCVHACLCVCF